MNQPMQLKDLKTLGWVLDEDGFAYERTFRDASGLVTLSINEFGDEYALWFFAKTNRDPNKSSHLSYEKLEDALNVANSAACVTPENPQGRWV